MKEITGNIWDYYDKGNWIVLTTNGTVRKDGACVMGRGVALQAKQRFPNLPFMLGSFISITGNKSYWFRSYRIITFPVKHNWWEKAILGLIENSCNLLVKDFPANFPIYMVRPGCGNGGLEWKDVKPVLEKYLDDRFIVVQK